MGVCELNKPAGSWCSHCKPGEGCGIYAERPTECRTFKCLWLGLEEAGVATPELRPDRSKVVLSFTQEHRLMAHLEKRREDALKAPLIIAMLRAAVARDGEAYVRCGDLVMTVK